MHKGASRSPAASACHGLWVNECSQAYEGEGLGVHSSAGDARGTEGTPLSVQTCTLFPFIVFYNGTDSTAY